MEWSTGKSLGWRDFSARCKFSSMHLFPRTQQALFMTCDRLKTDWHFFCPHSYKAQLRVGAVIKTIMFAFYAFKPATSHPQIVSARRSRTFLLSRFLDASLVLIATFFGTQPATLSELFCILGAESCDVDASFAPLVSFGLRSEKRSYELRHGQPIACHCWALVPPWPAMTSHGQHSPANWFQS